MHLQLLVIFALASTLAPATAQEREWSIDSTQDDVFLLFGTPGTDDVGASFWCRIGGKRVKIFFSDAAVGRPTGGMMVSMRVGAGSAAFTLPARLTQQAGEKRYSAEAEVSLSGRILDALSTAQFFTVTIGRHFTSYPFDPNNVDVFRRACGG